MFSLSLQMLPSRPSFHIPKWLLLLSFCLGFRALIGSGLCFFTVVSKLGLIFSPFDPRAHRCSEIRLRYSGHSWSFLICLRPKWDFSSPFCAFSHVLQPTYKINKTNIKLTSKQKKSNKIIFEN